jgi:hypothetical protein
MGRFAFLFAIVLTQLACSTDRTCDADAIALELAGTVATNCGRVAVNGDSTSTDQCVSEAFSMRHAFFARYDLRGTDSRVSRFVVGTASGKVYFLLWDSDPSGGSNAPETLGRTECVSPRLALATGGFTCESSGPTGRVCGG